MAKRALITEGQLFGDCIYIKEVPSVDDNGIRRRMGRFRCLCGKEFIDRVDKIKSGDSRGCGCRQGRIIHGLTRNGEKPDEFKIWCKIKERCYNVKDKRYIDYGARGIKVCDRWRYSFKLFYEDMGCRPNSTYSIERINNNGNYEPTNCKWGTKKNQARNRRSNVYIEYNGEKKCISEWAEILNLHQMTLWSRIFRYNWSIKKAFEFPKRESKKK